MKGERKCLWGEGEKISPWENDDGTLQELNYFSELPERKYIYSDEESQRTYPNFRGARSTATFSSIPTSVLCREKQSVNH